MPFVVVIVDALGGVVGSIVAVVGSMVAIRALFFAWHCIRAIRAARA